MNWSESTVTKLLIKDVERLDPVTVYIENYSLGRGKLTIEVFGDSWSAGWGAMGDNTLEQFVLSADNHYLSKNLSTLDALSEPDYEAVQSKCYAAIIRMRRETELNSFDARELWEKVESIEPDSSWFNDSYNHDVLYKTLGDEWWWDIPSKNSSEFEYLCRILDALKECLRLREEQRVAA